jgi:SNF2 family DNA or RNA helicase
LNLTCASKVIITDGWWNDASDQQAMSRVWRFGQRREVEVVRIYMKESIDTRKLELRDEKTEAIVKLAMKGIPE